MLSLIKNLVLITKNSGGLTVPIIIVCFTAMYFVSSDEFRVGLIIAGFLGGLICFLIYCIATRED